MIKKVMAEERVMMKRKIAMMKIRDTLKHSETWWKNQWHETWCTNQRRSERIKDILKEFET
jgi:hypothetical protein